MGDWIMNSYAIIAIIVWISTAVLAFLDMDPDSDGAGDYTFAVVVLPIIVGMAWIFFIPFGALYLIGWALRKLHYKNHSWNKS